MDIECTCSCGCTLDATKGQLIFDVKGERSMICPFCWEEHWKHDDCIPSGDPDPDDTDTSDIIVDVELGYDTINNSFELVIEGQRAHFSGESSHEVFLKLIALQDRLRRFTATMAEALSENDEQP